MGRINKEWHTMHKMPEKASDQQRIDWHLEHSRNCSCAPIPKGVLDLMAKRGMVPPEPFRGS